MPIEVIVALIAGGSALAGASIGALAASSRDRAGVVAQWNLDELHARRTLHVELFEDCWKIQGLLKAAAQQPEGFTMSREDFAKYTATSTQLHARLGLYAPRDVQLAARSFERAAKRGLEGVRDGDPAAASAALQPVQVELDTLGGTINDDIRSFNAILSRLTYGGGTRIVRHLARRPKPYETPPP